MKNPITRPMDDVESYALDAISAARESLDNMVEALQMKGPEGLLYFVESVEEAQLNISQALRTVLFPFAQHLTQQAEDA